MPRATVNPSQPTQRTADPECTRVPRGLWISLAASLLVLGARGAEASEAASHPETGAALALASLHTPAPGARATLGTHVGVAAGAGAPPVRLVLSAGRGSKPVVQGDGPGHRNPYTLVGNRTGLQDVARTEIRNGETWLVPAPFRESIVRETGLAAFQGGGSYIASR